MKLYTIILFFSVITIVYPQDSITSFALVTKNPVEYEKTVFNIDISAPFKNPYDQKDIKLDMVLISPSGKPIVLPCFYVSGNSELSRWNARFAAQESGNYVYHFMISRSSGLPVESKTQSFNVSKSNGNGFLHRNDFWTFKFDSGKLFRGIGENIGWESRSWEDTIYNYNYLLSSLARNGANFFRTWMCAWNLPLQWKHVENTNRYSNSDEYFNPGAIKRMDQLVDLTDSLGLYFMLTLSWHGALMKDGSWKDNNYNIVNGGPLKNPADFFTYLSAMDMYKNKLRYIIARWGYSTNIAAFEFFNEIDNAAFTHQDSVIISLPTITEWHDEMARYIKENDPYGHLITTSVSHRDIPGMNSLAHTDFNQKHIYKHTDRIPGILRNYTQTYNKPYVVAEFGYRWEDDNPKYGKEFDYDYKRGLWYGLFNPTPILPMTWWWELFDKRHMTPYLRSVREISDKMLKDGNGSFKMITPNSGRLESYGLQCGQTFFIYLLNNSLSDVSTDVSFDYSGNQNYIVQSFKPVGRTYENLGGAKLKENKLIIPNINLKSKDELLLIISTNEDK